MGAPIKTMSIGHGRSHRRPYQPDDNVRLEVRLQDDTVWLTQQQMTELFKTTKQNVSLHINNIFREGELMSDSVVKESLTTAGDEKLGDRAAWGSWFMVKC